MNICHFQWNGWKICFNVTEFFPLVNQQEQPSSRSSRRMEILLASSYGASQNSRTKWQETSSRIGSGVGGTRSDFDFFSLFFCYFIQYLWLFAECESGKELLYLCEWRSRGKKNCYLSIFLGYFWDITLILFVFAVKQICDLWFAMIYFFWILNIGKAEVVCWILGNSRDIGLVCDSSML